MKLKSCLEIRIQVCADYINETLWFLEDSQDVLAIGSTLPEVMQNYKTTVTAILSRYKRVKRR